MANVFVVVEAGFAGLPEALVEGFLVARNGSFLVKRLALDGKAFLELTRKVGEGFCASGMEPFRGVEGLVLHAPKIPRAKLEEVESFFRAVHNEHHAEAICLLYFTPSEGGLWRFVAPEQAVTYGSCDWTSPGAAPRGWYLAGSFHSHGSMSAFHSGTDNRDELGWDGVHVTVGKVSSPRPEYAASVVFGGSRHKVEIEDLVAPAEPTEFPEGWLGQVQKYQPPAIPLAEFGAGSIPGNRRAPKGRRSGSRAAKREDYE